MRILKSAFVAYLNSRLFGGALFLFTPHLAVISGELFGSVPWKRNFYLNYNTTSSVCLRTLVEHCMVPLNTPTNSQSIVLFRISVTSKMTLL